MWIIRGEVKRVGISSRLYKDICRAICREQDLIVPAKYLRPFETLAQDRADTPLDF